MAESTDGTGTVPDTDQHHRRSREPHLTELPSYGQHPGRHGHHGHLLHARPVPRLHRLPRTPLLLRHLRRRTAELYLYDVEYLVKAHFEWNENRPDLSGDRKKSKHLDIAKRMVEKGGRRDIFLGTRECHAYVEPCDYENVSSIPYGNIAQRSFGVMVHGITYPDEQTSPKFKGKMTVRLWKPVMKNGIIHFERPDSSDMIVRVIGGRNQKNFVYGENFSGLSEFDEKGVF